MASMFVGRFSACPPPGEEAKVETLGKMMLAMVDDIRVVLIKLADRLHNMRTLEHLDPERQQKIARETLDIYGPIAHRLGMGKIRGELEDLGFRYLDPISYQQVHDAVESRRKKGRSEEHTSELQSPDHLVCRLLLEKKKTN